MRGEIPQFRRCCCCMPLRRGLIAWAYFKLALSVTSVGYLVLILSLIRVRYHHYPTDIAIWTVICVVVIADISFNILFIVAGHRKNVKLLRITYIYNMVSLGVFLLCHCYQVYRSLRFLALMWGYTGHSMMMYYALDMSIRLGLAFTAIFVQVYLILLIRSELVKLQNQSLQIEFTNNIDSGEPQCTLHKTSTPDTDQLLGVEKQDNSAATLNRSQSMGEKAQENYTATPDTDQWLDQKAQENNAATPDADQWLDQKTQENNAATPDTEKWLDQKTHVVQVCCSDKK